MAPVRDRLEELAQLVASGREVDWESVLSQAMDADERRAIEQLRAVDGIAHGGGTAVAEATRTQTEVVKATTFTPGQTLGGRYRIQAFLGRGGMGEVWQAFDLKLRVDVALKSILRDQLASRHILERLRQEVRSAREVVSPNVCRIYDLEEIDGQELVSMEYIDGTTLLDVLRERGPLELREAGEIASQFLAGLEAIHEAGLVHRDVKPENIMITRAGRAVLMDFGLAKPESDREGTVSGTPAYMSPEQMRGEPLDARADIFAAGVVLAEMTSRQGIRDRPSRDSLHKGIHQDPPVFPDSPWRPVLERAVAKDASRRYPSTRDLIRALEDVTLRVEGAEELRPYPGLASFTEKDAEYFYGREVEAENLWKKLHRPHLLALIGPSGAGKTSFLRAGLIPSKPESWSVLYCTPGSRPFTSLAQVLADEFAGEKETVRELLRFEEADVAVSILRRWRQKHGEALLIIDQFEEVFTLNPREVQSRFADLLGRVALETDVHVLLSLRDDFAFNCAYHEPLAPVFSEMTPLRAISGAGLRRALVQPALQCGYRFEDDALVDDMLAEVAEERGALPLLAFAIGRLWERRDRDEGLLRREAYKQIGGVGGALAQHAETTIERIGSERVPIVREIFRNLITAQGTRVEGDHDELLSIFDDPKQADEVLRALIDARLLTSFEYTTGEGAERKEHRRLEIIHESLLSAWPRLVHWQTQDAEGAQLRDELRQAAQLWDQHGRSRDFLWTGAAFREYRLWRERYPGGLSTLEEEFAGAMTAYAQRKRRRRRLAITATVGFLAIGLSVVGWLWLRSERLRKQAEASELVLQGELMLASEPTVALAYAISSLELADNEPARLLALRVLQQAPVSRTMVPPPPGEGADRVFPFQLDFSPNGEWVATASFLRSEVFHWDGVRRLTLGGFPDTGLDTLEIRFTPRSDALVANHSGEIRIWSIPDGRELLRRQIDKGTSRLVMGGDGFLTLTDVGESTVIRRWPVGEGEPRFVGTMDPLGPSDVAGRMLAFARGPTLFLRPLEDWSARPREFAEHPVEIIDVAFSSDAALLATTDRSDTIRIWQTEAHSGAPLRVFEAEGTPWLRFGPHGRWLAAGGIVDGHSTIRLWDLHGVPGAEPITLMLDTPQMYGFTFDSSGKWLATAHSLSADFWWLGGDYPSVLRVEAAGGFLEFTPDGKSLVSSFGDGTLRVWPLFSGGPSEPKILLHDEEICCGDIAVDPTGRNIAAGGWGGRILLVPLDGGPIRQLEGFSSRVMLHGLAFDETGRLLAAATHMGPAEEKVIRVFDLDTGDVQVLGPVPGAGDGFIGSSGGFRTRLRFVGRDRLLAPVAGTGLVSFDLETGAASIVNPWPRGWAWPTTAKVGLGLTGPPSREWEPNQLIRYTLDGSEPVKLFTHGRAVWIRAAAFDNSEQLFASGSDDGTVRVGPSSGEEPHLLLGHTARIQGLAFSPDGRWLAAGAADGTIRIWRVPDVSKPPPHTLPLEVLLAKLRTHTNLRVSPNPASATGYSQGSRRFPGWAEPPEW